MSPKIINLILFLFMFQLCTSSLIENINESYELNMTNSTNFFDENAEYPGSEKLNQMRKLLIERELSEDVNNRSTRVPTLLFELFDSMAYLIYKYNLSPLLNNETVETCFYDGIIENIRNKHLVDIYIEGSGKALNDFGNEYLCDYKVRRNVSYLSIHFYMGTNYYLSETEEFFGQRYFYIGLCLPRKCMKAIDFLLRDENITKITHEVGLSNFKLYVNEDVDTLSEKLSRFYEIFIIVYFILNVLKLLISIGRVVVLNKGYEVFFSERYKDLDLEENIEEKRQGSFSSLGEENGNDITLDDSANDIKRIGTKESSRSSEKNMDIATFYNKVINENIISEEENLYNPFKNNEKSYPTYLKLIKLFDLFDNMHLMSSDSNRYFNSKNVKNLYLLRFLIMQMNIIHQIMYTQVYFPTKNFYNLEFYSHPMFFFIKFCINAPTFWITLDAILFGYKLMSFLKKEVKLNKGNEASFLTFLKFSLLIFPKFFGFVFGYLLLHLYANRFTFELAKFNNSFSNYLYYNDTVQQMSYSLRHNENPSDFFKHFIPFRLNYIDFFENVTIITHDINEVYENYTSDVSGYEIPSPFLTNTELFVNVYFNEFYLTIIILLITYISYKFKSTIFDITILIINAILYIFPAIEAFNPFKGNIEEQNYTLKYVLGQNYTEKYTHYFINFFYFGFLIGVMKFYLEQNYYENKKKKLIFSKIDLPFEFCKKFIIYVNRLKLYIKRFILWACVFFLFLIASSFNILEGNKFTYNEINFVKITGITKFLFFYEKNLSGIFLFISLIMYISYPKSTFINKISNASLFIICERISYCFFTSFSYLVYAQFCVFIMNMQISFSNILFNTVGIFIITFCFSVITTALLELPVRQLIKDCMNKNLEKKFRSCYNLYFPGSRSGSISDDSQINTTS